MTQQDSTSSPTDSLDESGASDSPLLRTGGEEAGRGEGIDREVESPLVTSRRVAVGLVVAAVVGALGYGVWTTATGGQVLNVDRETMTISTAQQGDFQEFIAVMGTAIPEQTVYLDAVEGGRVEEVLVEEGARVEAGQSLVRLSNNDLHLRLARTEARLAEQRSRMQQIQINVEQRRLRLQRDLAQIRHEISRLERQFERQKRLHEQDLIADEEFQQTREGLQYQRRRLELTRSAYRQDSLTYQSRMVQQQKQRQRLDQRSKAVREAIESLTIRAPTDGELTALTVVRGQIISQGTRVGQVDEVGRYKLRAQIDEFYIERVRHGQTATTDALGDTTRTLRVDRVYPQVENGRFEVDLTFTADSPPTLRRGQSVRLRLRLGQSKQALLLPRGGFYQSTGGNWAYVLTDDGDAAVRRSIRLGRQNPDHFEVLEGLEPGDRVVTSSYDTFGDADRLSLE